MSEEQNRDEAERLIESVDIDEGQCFSCGGPTLEPDDLRCPWCERWCPRCKTRLPAGARRCDCGAVAPDDDEGE